MEISDGSIFVLLEQGYSVGIRDRARPTRLTLDLIN